MTLKRCKQSFEDLTVETQDHPKTSSDPKDASTPVLHSTKSKLAYDPNLKARLIDYAGRSVNRNSPSTSPGTTPTFAAKGRASQPRQYNQEPQGRTQESSSATSQSGSNCPGGSQRGAAPRRPSRTSSHRVLAPSTATSPPASRRAGPGSNPNGWDHRQQHERGRNDWTSSSSCSDDMFDIEINNHEIPCWWSSHSENGSPKSDEQPPGPPPMHPRIRKLGNEWQPNDQVVGEKPLPFPGIPLENAWQKNLFNRSTAESMGLVKKPCRRQFLGTQVRVPRLRWLPSKFSGILRQMQKRMPRCMGNVSMDSAAWEERTKFLYWVKYGKTKNGGIIYMTYAKCANLLLLSERNPADWKDNYTAAEFDSRSWEKDVRYVMKLPGSSDEWDDKQIAGYLTIDKVHACWRPKNQVKNALGLPHRSPKSSSTTTKLRPVKPLPAQSITPPSSPVDLTMEQLTPPRAAAEAPKPQHREPVQRHDTLPRKRDTTSSNGAVSAEPSTTRDAPALDSHTQNVKRYVALMPCQWQRKCWLIMLALLLVVYDCYRNGHPDLLRYGLCLLLLTWQALGLARRHAPKAKALPSKRK